MNDGENIRKELKKIAPEIQWKLNVPDFSIPEGYFQQVSQEIWEKIRVEEGEKEFTRTLPYRVPDGYFDRLPGNVLDKVQTGTEIISLPRRRRRHEWTVAAAIACIVALAGLLSRPSQPANTKLDTQLASISDHAIEQYLNAHLNSLSTEDLYEYLSPPDQQSPVIENIPSQAIEEYLHDNVGDIPDSL